MKRLALCLALLASPLWAVEVRDCEGFVANARNVAWDDPTRTYANGMIRLIRLDTEEPACCAFHLMVLHPAGDDPFLACSMISQSEGYGWSTMSLAGAQSSYVPGQGLRIEVPVEVYGTEGPTRTSLSVTVNQAAGSVSAE